MEGFGLGKHGGVHWLLGEGDVGGVCVAGHDVDGDGGAEFVEDIVEGLRRFGVVGGSVVAVFFGL